MDRHRMYAEEQGAWECQESGSRRTCTKTHRIGEAGKLNP